MSASNKALFPLFASQAARAGPPPAPVDAPAPDRLARVASSSKRGAVQTAGAAELRATGKRGHASTSSALPSLVDGASAGEASTSGPSRSTAAHAAELKSRMVPSPPSSRGGLDAASGSRTIRSRDGTPGLSRSRPTTKDLAITLDSSDSDDLYVAQPSKRSPQKVTTSRPPVKKPTLASVFVQGPKKARGAAVASTSGGPAIVLSASPSPKKHVPAVWLLGSFGERTNKRETVVLDEARWPTLEEHTVHWSVREAAQGQVLETGARWAGRSTAQDKGKGHADVLDQLAQTVAGHLAASSTPATSSGHPSTRVQHSLEQVRSLIPKHPPHPLLDRLSTTLLDPSSFLRPSGSAAGMEPWTVKYAPKSAAEVLGVESGHSAQVLKDWLEQLAIRSASELAKDSKKHARKVVRSAAKGTKRRREQQYPDDLEDFIAPEDASELDSDGDAPRREMRAEVTFPELTNLILLLGKVGTGKTSSVHAVAAELGWQVFEVYPGIGKRGARDIEGYVGEVAKNHTVWKANPFETARKRLEVDVQEEGRGVKQSLILFDEIDVLFKEDKDFWPGIVELVKSSQRPVIMTCNDPALIPINDLPLQKITSKGTTLAFLQFSPAEPSLAVPFLQLLALTDGHIYPSAEMHSTYTTASPLVARSKVFRQDQAVLPEEFADEVSWDLRRTMVRLQWECQSAVVGSGSEGSLAEGTSTWFEHPAGGLGDTTLDDGGRGSLKSCMRAAETASWADSFVARRIEIASDMEEPCPNAAALEGELSWQTVLTDLLVPERNQLGVFGREEEMCDWLLEAATRTRGRSWPPLVQIEYEAKRTETVLLAQQMLDGVNLAPPSPYLPHPSLFLDYLPALRLISTAEDQHVLNKTGLDVPGNRRSARRGQVYQRRIDWDDELAEQVHRSGFDSVV